MSDLQKDKDVLEERREPLEGVEAPVRDQIDRKLLNTLRDEDFGRKIEELWATAQSERSMWLQRQQTYLAEWDNFIPNEANGDEYEGTSNLHIPMAFTVVKTYHARILQALLANKPHPVARRPDSLEREKMVAQTMQYAVSSWANDFEGIDEQLDVWVWQWLATGAGTLKSRWETKFEKFVDVVEVPEQTTVFGVDEEGNEVAQPALRLVEKEQDRVIEIFNGPKTEFVPEEDIIVIGGEGDPQRADHVIQQQWLTASELWMLVDRKVFDEDAVREVLKSGEDSKTQDEGGDIKQQRDFRAGHTVLDSSIDHDRYRIIEAYTSYDVDGNGINSEIIAWVHPKTGEVLRATYLRRVNKGGKRPFFRAEFHKRPGTPYPIGLVEILYPLATEMDAMHNMRIDAGIISTMPFGFYKASSSLNPETIRYEPGSLIPVDDPQRDVFFPNLGNRTAFGLQEEAAIQTLVERLTGVSDLTLGSMSGSQGATRTATGTRALVGEANANIDVHLKRLFRAWRQYLRHLLHMLQQRIPPGLSFKVTGDDGQKYWQQVRGQDDIAGDFDFENDPSSADSNPQVRMEKAVQVMNLVQNPFFIQLGTVTPRGIFEAQKSLLSAMDVKEWSRYIQEPPNSMLMLSPEEEVNRILRGIEVPVDLQGDHEGFLQYFQFIMKTPELLSQFGEEQVVALARQAQQHEKMIQAISQMQAQQANVQQMRVNAQQSQNQAPTGANPLMGGGQLSAAG